MIDKEIQHRSFGEGRFQSLGPIGEDGNKRYTVGIFLPGEYVFEAKFGDEHTTVIEGSCEVNGLRLTRGETIVVQKGERVVMKTEETCSYICRFL